MRIVNSEEQKVIEGLKARGVLELLDPQKMKDGVLVLCGDCDRSADKFDHYRHTLQLRGQGPRIHLVALNGGPLNLVHPHSDDLRERTAIQTFLLENQILGSLVLKGLPRTIFMAHWPCGQAEGWNLTMTQAFELLAAAVRKAKHRLGSDYEVVAHVHLDKGETKRTYHFCVHRWQEWRAANPTALEHETLSTVTA